MELAVKDPHKLVIVDTTRGHRLEGFDNNVALFGGVDTVQELSDLRNVTSKLSTVSAGEKTRELTSLFLTRHLSVIDAADCETFSMSFPSITSSSLAPSLMVTPANMGHFRTTFSPTIIKAFRQPVIPSVFLPKSPTEVSDLNGLSVTGDNRVDGEMGVYQLHLVLVTLGDTGDHVGNHGLDGSETGNVLSGTVPHGELGLSTLDTLDLKERHRDQTAVLE